MLNKIVQILRPAPNAGRLLFTSWTEKEALSDLVKFAETLNCQAVIVSRDNAVSRAAADLGMVSVTGDFLSSVEGSHHQFSLVVVPGENISPNPNDPGFTEWQHVLNASSYLRSQGLMAFVVNQKRLGNNLQKVVNLLQAYRDLRVFRLQADSLLVIGVRRGTRSNSDPERFHTIAEAIRSKDLIDLPDDRIYDLPDMRTYKQIWFRSKFFDPSLIEKIAAGLPWGEKTLKTAMTGWKLPPLEPVLPLRAMHLGAAISSGALGSLRVTSTKNGDHYVVRGRTIRRIRQSYSREEDAVSESGLFSGHKAEKDQQTGDFVTDISLINLTQASIQHINPQSPKEMHAFLEEFGAPLAKSAAVNYAPLYEPRDKPYQEVLNPELVRVIDAPLNWTAGKVVNISGTEVPSLTNRQRHFTAASFLKLLGKDAVTPDLRPAYPDTPGRLIISGQTAVGKTMISHRLQLGLQLVRASKEGRKLGDGNWPLSIFIGTPANIPHIFSELRVAAPLFDTREVRSRKDLLQILDDVPHNPRPIMMVISRTMLRQMQQIEPAFNFGIPRFETDRHGDVTPNLKCPTCGSKINIGRKDAKNWPDASFLCANTRVRSRGRKCSHCNSPLFQETHNGKYNLALTLRRELKKRPIKLLSLVIDEVHEDANLTNQGAAMGWVADLAEYVVGMSGTVYGGTPSTVFYLLFRLIPSFREQWDIGEVDRFVSQYGNWRQRKKEDGKWGKKVALPGISPELIAGIFLNYATFITQADAGLPMPERHDIPIELTATKEEQEGLRLAADAFRAVVRADGLSHERRLNAIGTAAQQLYVAPVGFHLRELAPFSPAYSCTSCGKRKVGTIDPCQHYWLRTEDELEDMAQDRRERVQAILAEPVLDPSWRSTKERALVDFVSREREEQRVPLIFVYHTGKYKIDDRIEMVLADAGFRTINLRTTQVKRLEMVVNNAAFNGFDAVIANPAKVGTGLNLIGTPSIFWYQPIWPPKLKIQASARPDRPTQTRQVRVFYPVIKGSAEAVILSKVMEKIISIYLLAGIDYEGLSEVMEAVGHTESFTEAMIRFVSHHVETDLSTMFEQLAKLDTGRTNDHEIAVYQADQARKVIEPIDLENATQLSFF